MLGVLLRMGAHIREAVEDIEHLEPRGVVEVTGVPLKATVVQGEEVPQLIDELPILSIGRCFGERQNDDPQCRGAARKRNRSHCSDRAQSAHHGRASRRVK